MAASRLRASLRRLSPHVRARGKTIRAFANKLGLVYFGAIHQHDDDIDAIRGFTASTTHADTHFCVGTYEGYNIRLVDRFDLVPLHQGKHLEQFWVILEVELQSKQAPRTFFVPTGPEATAYQRLYATNPHLQPLNKMLFSTHSPEFHGRFNILSRTAHVDTIEHIFTSPLIVGIAARFWPHGLEVHNGKLYVYITHRPTRTVLESILQSSLWLAEMIDEQAEVN